MALTASCLSTAPGIAAMLTRAGLPCAGTRVIAGWRLAGSEVIVPVTTAPACVRATPSTDCDAAPPKDGVRRQDAPFADTKATSDLPACPLTTAPTGPPFTMPEPKPPGAFSVAWKVQAMPFGER